MSFGGTNINKMDGNIGYSSSSDRVVVLVMGMTVNGDLAYNKAEKLLDITSVENLGVTASTDNTNGELAYYHLSEMFRLSPETTFYLIPVDKSKTVAQLVVDEALLAAIRSVDNVNAIGFAGIATAVTAAITDALLFQSMVNAFNQEHLLIDGVFVEGVGGDEELAIGDYDDLRTLEASNITYVIAQDPTIAALHASNAKRASIGTVLGSVAVRRVHEDIGSVDIEVKPRNARGQENYSLSSQVDGVWQSAALSDGKLFSTLTPAEQKSLTAKGWMYVGKFADYSGYYFNGCPTAVSKASDYAYFNNNCIWNKAARIIRAKTIPRVRSKIPKDPNTGQIKSTWTSGLEAVLLKALETQMESVGNIDGKSIYIDPVQSPNEDTPLRVKGQVVVGDIVHEFDVDLGLTKQL